MKERPILVAVIGYMIGILWGLYFQFSIVLCYILILSTYLIQRKFFLIHKKQKFKLISFQRYHRYIKILINRKVILIFMVVSIISNQIILYQNKQYETTYQEGENLELIGVVISQKVEKQYYDLYQIKVSNQKHFNLLIQVNKKMKELEYGDKVKLQGSYQKPEEQKNDGGYDDKQYLKTLKIIGRVKIKKIEVMAKKQINAILQLANHVKKNIKGIIEERFEEKKASILKGLLLGETNEIDEETKENFQASSISHVLAISGAHIHYIIIGMKILCQKKVGKRKTNIIIIVVLLFYSFMTGFSPSIIRSVVMAIITIGADVLYRKSDIWNMIAISLWGILIYNPFLILSVGLQLSYLGTIGIIIFYPNVLKILNQIAIKKEHIVFQKIKEVTAISLSAQMMILPILLYHFNYMGMYFLITNLLVSFIMGPIIMLGFLCVISKLFVILESILLMMLDLITKFRYLPFANFYVPTPPIIAIILYFIGVMIVNKIYSIYHLKQLTATDKRVKNLIAFFQYRFHEKKKFFSKIILIVLLSFVIFLIVPKDLKIYFIDVGQGDCTFIVTPNNKTILVDGGGHLLEEFNVGKRTVVPYLLDRGHTTIDYVVISHFDQDHVRSDY